MDLNRPGPQRIGARSCAQAFTSGAPVPVLALQRRMYARGICFAPRGNLTVLLSSASLRLIGVLHGCLARPHVNSTRRVIIAVQNGTRGPPQSCTAVRIPRVDACGPSWLSLIALPTVGAAPSVRPEALEAVSKLITRRGADLPLVGALEPRECVNHGIVHNAPPHATWIDTKTPSQEAGAHTHAR